MSVASASFAVWVSAWLHGQAASDDVLDALRAWGRRHFVIAADPDLADTYGLPVTGVRPVPLVDLLAGLRRNGVHSASLVLPVAGDTRGLGGGGRLVAAALEAGEAAAFGDAGLAAVPTGGGEEGMLWTVYPLTQADAFDRMSIGEAEHGLTEAVRDSAETLAALDVANERSDVREALALRLRAQPRPAWPGGTPGRALRVLQKADEIAAIVTLADADSPGGAVSASSARHRAEALRPLSAAIRDARCVAVNTAARAFAEQASEHP